MAYLIHLGVILLFFVSDLAASGRWNFGFKIELLPRNFDVIIGTIVGGSIFVVIVVIVVICCCCRRARRRAGQVDKVSNPAVEMKKMPNTRRSRDRAGRVDQTLAGETYCQPTTNIAYGQTGYRRY